MRSKGATLAALSAESAKAAVQFEDDSLAGIAEGNAGATEQMAATIRETSRTVDHLSLQAEKLNLLVGRFRA